MEDGLGVGDRGFEVSGRIGGEKDPVVHKEVLNAPPGSNH